MAAPLLVELCAGSGAVSLCFLDRAAKPPVRYQGGKQRYAPQILALLGLQPGQGQPDHVLLVEPGPYGAVWALLRTRRGRAQVLAALAQWAEEDPRHLWERLRDQPVPRGVAAQVAAWLVLQFWSYAGKPVLVETGSFRTNGFNRCSAYRHACHDEAAQPWKDGVRGRNQGLQSLLAAIEALPDLTGLHVLRCLAQEVEPIPGSIVLLDPDYRDSGTRYGFSLSRAEVVQIARRWKAAGARVVAICERERVMGRAHVLGKPTGGRTLAAGHPEVVSIL